MKDLHDLKTYWISHSTIEMVLCTIVRKSGSGYRGVGAKKIIQRDGSSCGYLSGGCLEGEIIRTVCEHWGEVPFIRSFSTMSEEDRLMGYQTGCAGIIEILFERLPSDISHMDKYLPFGLKQEIEAIGVSLSREKLGEREIFQVKPEQTNDIFIDPWVEPLSLYIIGCGANAGPFAELAPPLGWDVTFLDYRQGNTIPERPRVKSFMRPLKEIGEFIPQGLRTAVVIMTHNYEADLSIVGQLNKKTFGYIGCVGPRKRFDQISDDLKKLNNIVLDEDWALQVHASAGLKQGRNPEDIAFSINRRNTVWIGGMTVWTIILAAGAGSRFGGPKALAPWKENTLLSNAKSLAPLQDKIVVVTGAHEALIGRVLNDTRQAHNPQWSQGMGSSVSTGLDYVSKMSTDIALIVPVDQPFITKAHLEKLAQQALAENRCILTLDGSVSGPPAAIPARLFSAFLELKDKGLKSVLSDFGLCEGPGMLRDIDTPEDLNRFTTIS